MTYSTSHVGREAAVKKLFEALVEKLDVCMTSRNPIFLHPRQTFTGCASEKRRREREKGKKKKKRKAEQTNLSRGLPFDCAGTE